jgi:hypothetical protein
MCFCRCSFLRGRPDGNGNLIKERGLFVLFFVVCTLRTYCRQTGAALGSIGVLYQETGPRIVELSWVIISSAITSLFTGEKTEPQN